MLGSTRHKGTPCGLAGRLIAVFALAGSAGAVSAQVSSIDPFGSLVDFSVWFDARALDSASLAADATPVFADAFRAPALDERRWEFAADSAWIADARDGGVRLAAGEDRPLAELRTRPFDLSPYGGARVRLRAVHVGFSSEPLEIECVDRVGGWIRLESNASASSTEASDYELPAGALHDAAQIRIRTAATGTTGEAWIIREISIFGRTIGPAHVLSVAARPDLPIALTLRATRDAQLVYAAVPLPFTLPEGGEGRIVAPPVLEGLVLSE